MSANRREALTILSFKLAKSEVADARRAIGQLELGYEELGEIVRETDRIIAAGGSRLQQLGRRSSRTALDVTELRDAIEGAAEAQEDFNRQQAANTGGGRGAFGIGFGAQRFAGLASGLGLGGAGEGLRLVDDISDAAQSLPLLKESIAGLGATGFIAVGALGAFALGVALFNKSLEESKRAIDAATAANTAYFQAIGGTTQDVRQQADQLTTSLEQNRAELANIEQAYTTAFDQQAEATDDFAARIGFAFVQVSNADDTLVARADELRTAIAREESQLGGLQRALESAEVATNDAAAAELALAEARQANTDRQISNEIRVLSNLNQTTEGIDNRIEAIEREREIIEQYIAGGQASAALTQELTNRMTDLAAEESLLAIRIRPLIDEREREAEALAFQQQQLQEVTAALKAYNADVERIEQKALQDRANAQDKFNKALVNAAEAAADAAENALQKLLDARQDLARDFGRDLTDLERDAQQDALDIRIDAQRDEAAALRDHQREIADILRQAQRDEQDLIANRDFAGLFRLRRDTGQRIEDAQRTFNEERGDQIEAYRQQIADAQTQYAREREQRQAQYVQDIADATLQYQRELQQAEVNRRKALQKAAQAYADEQRLLQQKFINEINLTQQAYQQELQLAAQSSQTRVAIMQKELQIAQQVLASLGKGTSGGATAAGATSGMAIPGGSTTSIRGGATVNQTNNISGASNPQVTANVIIAAMERLFGVT